jgi:hypothetical protein
MYTLLDGLAGNAREAALTELNTSLEILRAYPAPLQAWKTYAVLGRLYQQTANQEAARDAFAESAAIVQHIAGNVEEEALRATFLASAAVSEVLVGAQGVAAT